MNLKFHILISISGHMSQSSTNYEHYSVPRRRTPLRSNSLCDIRTENLSSQGMIWKNKFDSYILKFLIFSLKWREVSFECWISENFRLFLIKLRQADFAEKKCVNRDIIDFKTKQQEVYIIGDILHITHMPDVNKFQISPHLSCKEN